MRKKGLIFGVILVILLMVPFTPAFAPPGSPAYSYVTGWFGYLGYPHAVAERSGYLYVADSYNCRVVKFDSTGHVVDTWGSYGTDNGFFIWPAGIALDTASNVYVADTGNNRIQKFTTTGNFIDSWGRADCSSGTRPGEFNQPYGIEVDWLRRYVYVADTINQRIQKFTLNGHYLTSWGYTPGAIQPYGIGVDISTGDVYISDRAGHRIVKYNQYGNYLCDWGSYGRGDGQFDNPYGIAVDNWGYVYVADSYNNRIQVFTTTGNHVNNLEGPISSPGAALYCPDDIFVSRSGYVFVADTMHNRIAIFRRF